MQEASSGASASEPNQAVRIRYGIQSKQGDMAGKTIGQIKAEVGRGWKMTEDTVAVSGTQKLDDDYIVKAGENIEFTRRQGEKG